jgi:hypothetical protein
MTLFPGNDLDTRVDDGLCSKNAKPSLKKNQSKNSPEKGPVEGPRRRTVRRKTTTQRLSAFQLPPVANPILKNMEEGFENDDKLMELAGVVSELKNGVLSESIQKIHAKVGVNSQLKRHNFELTLKYVRGCVYEVVKANAKKFKESPLETQFMVEIVRLSLLHEHKNMDLMKSYLKQKLGTFIDEVCEYLLDPVKGVKNISVRDMEGLMNARDQKFENINNKEDLQLLIAKELNQKKDWIKMYEFFAGSCFVGENGIGKEILENIMLQTIQKDKEGKVAEVWEMIYEPQPVEEVISSNISDKVKKALAIASMVVGVSGITYMGYKNLINNGDNPKTPAINKANFPKQTNPNLNGVKLASKSAGAPEDQLNNRPVHAPVMPSMNIRPMKVEPQKSVSGSMDIRKVVDMQIQAKKVEPSIIIEKTQAVISQKLVEPVPPVISKVESKVTPKIVKPIVPKITPKPRPVQEVKIASSQQIGLVKIDEQSLAKMQDSDYKKMFEGFEFSLDEVKGRSITGLIEKHLMSQAKSGKERRAYRKNLQKLEKGWLIYMRQLELRVKKKIESGEVVNERDMADYDFWMMYKTDHRGNYEKAKKLAKKYKKLAKKGKKSHNFKRYQEYLDMGTDLMEGLRTLNPKVASVNVVPSWNKIRMADGNGNVLQYLHDVGGKMGLEVPSEAKFVAEIKKETKNIASEICKVEEAKKEISNKASSTNTFASGVIENTSESFQRSSDLNSFHAVNQLETMFDAAPSVTPSVNVMGASNADDFDSYYADMFPWEREKAIEDLRVREARKIEIEMDYDMQDTADDVAMYEDEILLTPDHWVDNTDIGINNNSFDIALPPVATDLPKLTPPPFAPIVKPVSIEIDAEYDFDDNSKNVSLWSEEKAVDADWSVLDQISTSERFYDDFENLDLSKETIINGYVEDNNDIENPKTGNMFQEGLNEHSLEELKNIKFADNESDFDCEVEFREPKVASNEIAPKPKKSKKEKKKKKGFFGKIGSWFKKKKAV